MSAPPYMRLYWGDYHRDTRHLTRSEHGAYFLLLGELWNSGGKLPAEDATLARLTLCTPAEWAEIKPVLMPFFRVLRGKLTHKRITAELAKYDDTLRKRKEAGRKGGAAKHGKDGENPQANAGQKPPKPEPEPEPEPDRTSVPNGTGAVAPDIVEELRGQEPKRRAWALAKRVLTERGDLTAQKAGALIGQWMRDLTVDADDLWAIAEATWKAGTDNPVPYMAKALAERAKVKGGSVQIDAPSEDRQRAWMADFAEAPARWRTYERGPRPGEAGCRVSAEIQRAHGVEPHQPQEVGAAVLPFPPIADRRSA